MCANTTLHEIESMLGPPAHSGEGYLIYQGDCMDYLKHLEDGALALTVTSPPYNIGKEYESIREIDHYIEWCKRWIHELYRVTSDNGSFWLNLGYVALASRAKAIPIPYLLWDQVPFFMLQEIVWNYGAGVAAKRTFSPRNEKFLWYVKNPDDYVFNLDDIRDPSVKYPNQKKNGKLKCNPLGKNPTDVWQIPKVTSGKDRSSKERTLHPAQFPIAVVERIVKACSAPGDIVLDPFLGSGSLIEAALRSERLAIGFEINPKYVDLAAKRVRAFLRARGQQLAQRPLFR
ncbi:MAG: site-specific DNA-methyltransferase [Planctomycetaceae bacterium]|nr:site-specific DNA-methyltransferase [Planctomycetaceae bacterium]